MPKIIKTKWQNTPYGIRVKAGLEWHRATTSHTAYHPETLEPKKCIVRGIAIKIEKGGMFEDFGWFFVPRKPSERKWFAGYSKWVTIVPEDMD